MDTVFGATGLDAKTLEMGQELTWIRASQQGDDLAFNRLVLKWERPIFNLSLRMLHNADEAAEATQEIFFSVFKNIRRFRLDAKFSSWLYRIAVNQCISRLRRRPPGVHCSIEDDRNETPILDRVASRQSHEEDLLRAETRNEVRHALEFLVPEQRAAVELKFYQELTFDEIAEIVQVPLSTVKSRFYSGLEILKLRLGGKR